MRIKSLVNAGMAVGSLSAGRIYDLPESQAREFLRLGWAEEVTATAATPLAPAVTEMYGRPLSAYETMSDKEIIALPDIDKAGLKKIREAIAARSN